MFYQNAVQVILPIYMVFEPCVLNWKFKILLKNIYKFMIKEMEKMFFEMLKY